MLFYFMIFVIFLLVAQFAISMLPFLLPLFLIFFVISLFKKPDIKVYTHTFTFPDSAYSNAGVHTGHSSGSEMPKLITRTPMEGSIDAEYTEYAELDETGE